MQNFEGGFFESHKAYGAVGVDEELFMVCLGVVDLALSRGMTISPRLAKKVRNCVEQVTAEGYDLSLILDKAEINYVDSDEFSFDDDEETSFGDVE
jgi:hypothetical protein